MLPGGACCSAGSNIANTAHCCEAFCKRKREHQTEKDDIPFCYAGANSPPAGRGPFQKLSSMKTRSGELSRPHSASAQKPISPQASGGSLPQPHQTSFSHTGSWGQKGAPQGVPQGAVQGTTHQSPFAHSHSWGPRTAPQGVLQGAPLQGASSATLPQGAVPGSLASASSSQLGSRAAPPATPPQQPGQEPHVLFQVS